MKNTFFALALLFAAPVFSQEVYRVISENGLKLRATPSKTGAVLAFAPFWSEVKLLTKVEEENYDDSGRPITKWPDTVLFGDRKLLGHWWQVKFGGQKGFMFSPFLIQKRTKKEDLFVSEADSLFKTSGWRFAEGPKADSLLNWIGIFKKGDAFEVRPVKIHWAVDLEGCGDEIEPLTCRIESEVAYDDFFFFETTEKILRRKLKGWSVYRKRYEQGDAYEKAFSKAEQIKNGVFESLGHWFSVDSNGKEHSIDRLNYAEQDGQAAVIWFGDLDRDGKNDFIFASSDGNSGCFTLLLSSKGKKGKPLGLAAIRFFGSCC